MTPFSHPEFDGHEEIAFCNDAESGLKAIIAIHNTNLGPALGEHNDEIYEKLLGLDAGAQSELRERGVI